MYDRSERDYTPFLCSSICQRSVAGTKVVSSPRTVSKIFAPIYRWYHVYLTPNPKDRKERVCLFMTHSQRSLKDIKCKRVEDVCVNFYSSFSSFPTSFPDKRIFFLSINFSFWGVSSQVTEGVRKPYFCLKERIVPDTRKRSMENLISKYGVKGEACEIRDTKKHLKKKPDDEGRWTGTMYVEGTNHPEWERIGVSTTNCMKSRPKLTKGVRDLVRS